MTTDVRADEPEESSERICIHCTDRIEPDRPEDSDLCTYCSRKDDAPAGWGMRVA